MAKIGNIMKSLLLCLVIAMVCTGLESPARCQEPGKQTKSSPDTLPAEVCTALQAYIAKVSTARSLTDKAKRQERYNEAKAQLEPTLRRHNRTGLLAQALSFASYSEQVVATDAADPKLPDLLDKRAKSRQTLLGSCADYVTAR